MAPAVVDICLSLACLALSAGMVSPLHMVTRTPPAVVRNGSVASVLLDCNYGYDRHEAAGLTVKWFWAGDHEPVYQWIPGGVPEVRGILKDRVNVRHRASHDNYTAHRALQIMRPTTDLSGTYTCAVSSYFDEERQTIALLVYAPPAAMNLSYHKASPRTINVTCDAHGLFPRPRIALYARAHSPNRFQIKDTHVHIVKHSPPTGAHPGTPVDPVVWEAWGKGIKRRKPRVEHLIDEREEDTLSIRGSGDTGYERMPYKRSLKAIGAESSENPPHSILDSYSKISALDTDYDQSTANSRPVDNRNTRQDTEENDASADRYRSGPRKRRKFPRFKQILGENSPSNGTKNTLTNISCTSRCFSRTSRKHTRKTRKRAKPRPKGNEPFMNREMFKQKSHNFVPMSTSNVPEEHTRSSSELRTEEGSNKQHNARRRRAHETRAAEQDEISSDRFSTANKEPLRDQLEGETWIHSHSKVQPKITEQKIFKSFTEYSSLRSRDRSLEGLDAPHEFSHSSSGEWPNSLGDRETGEERLTAGKEEDDFFEEDNEWVVDEEDGIAGVYSVSASVLVSDEALHEEEQLLECELRLPGTGFLSRRSVLYFPGYDAMELYARDTSSGPPAATATPSVGAGARLLLVALAGLAAL